MFQFSTFETVSTCLIDVFYDRLHKYKTLIVAALMTTFFITGIPLTTSVRLLPFLNKPQFQRQRGRGPLKTMSGKKKCDQRPFPFVLRFLIIYPDKFHILSGIYYLSHSNPCFQCYIAITNLQTCGIRFHDAIGQSTVHMYSYARILKHGDIHGQMSMSWTLIFQFDSLDSVL